MRKKIVMSLAAAVATLALVPAPSSASTCAVANPEVDAIVCGIVVDTVFGVCREKPGDKICPPLG